MSFTHSFTHPFRREGFTLPRKLHAPVVRSFTHPFTGITRPELHARHPLYRGGRAVRRPIHRRIRRP